MCRIAGIWNFSKDDPVAATCSRMIHTMRHGGPDDAGVYVDPDANCAIGHRRLAIIDLSKAGHQPMISPDGRFILAYNGEVYNYRELQERLSSDGIRFIGQSDAEVVLHAFIKWGPACVHRFIGMFAFAVWDSLKKELFLFRDRLGVKPLYYYTGNGLFAFASELKALHRVFADRLEVDTHALGEFFQYGYISSPRSIYKQVRKVLPGEYCHCRKNGTVKAISYYRIPPPVSQTPFSATDEALTDQLEALMIDAFKKRLIADVPVGVFLSGGIDSSLVTAIIAKHTPTPVKTFTIGFAEKAYDESEHARKIAAYLGTDHTEQIMTPQDVAAILDDLPTVYDEPFGDLSCIPTLLLSRITRRKVKVSLSADGGDELFCGYRIYRNMQILANYFGYCPKALLRFTGRRLIALSHGNDWRFKAIRSNSNTDRFHKLTTIMAHWPGNAASAYPLAVCYYAPQEISALIGAYADHRLPPAAPNGGLLQALMNWDMRHYLPEDILTKVDRATMFASLEGREPFLDHRLVEFAARLPCHMKQHRTTSKYILKKILARYLPESLFNRPKKGFSVPIHRWLATSLVRLIHHHLAPDVIKRQSHLDPMAVRQAVKAYERHPSEWNAQRIWLLLMFRMWQEKYV